MKVSVVPHQISWKSDFDHEAKAIRSAISAVSITLHHIGSTSIPGILAKPIIDLLGVVADLDAIDRHCHEMESLGYEVMGSFGIEGRRHFRKSDASGRRMHHLHVFEEGSSHVERHLVFRDYLRGNPSKAKAYSELKARVTAQGEVTWDDYMDAKDPFIKTTEVEAVDWYRRQKSGRH